ncbi:hypothetical protein Q8F55_000989 [Vanrija albida]|uniref:Uncharacterized protein n=1 Tax=Vanrija albida TaxID=181172 RepID=A0ABR3QFW1_9TREE
MRVAPLLLTATALLGTNVAALTKRETINAFTNFLDNFLAPNNEKVAASINSTLFAEDVTGTVDVSTNFDGRELSVEYLFGLFVNVHDDERPNIIGSPIAYEVTSLMAQNNYVFASIKFDFFYSKLNLHYPVQIDAWMLFNEQKEVQQYDVSFRRWAWAVDNLAPKILPQMAQYANITNTTDPAQILTRYSTPIICGAHEIYCKGDNQQYKSYSDCVSFISKTPLGTFYRMGEDNILCRSLHVPMLPLRPSVHCPHIGPTGGGMCVARNYTEVVLDNHFPKGFIASKCVKTLRGPRGNKTA